MSAPSPRDLTSNLQRRQELVKQAMERLEGVHALPTDQQLSLLSDAQAVLSGVLNNDSELSQLGIPGISAET